MIDKELHKFSDKYTYCKYQTFLTFLELLVNSHNRVSYKTKYVYSGIKYQFKQIPNGSNVTRFYHVQFAKKQEMEWDYYIEVSGL